MVSLSSFALKEGCVYGTRRLHVMTLSPIHRFLFPPISLVSLGRAMFGFATMSLGDRWQELRRQVVQDVFAHGFGWVLFGLGGRGPALGCQRSTPQALAMSRLMFNNYCLKAHEVHSFHRELVWVVLKIIVGLGLRLLSCYSLLVAALGLYRVEGAEP